jgi:hypothetical protein
MKNSILILLSLVGAATAIAAAEPGGADPGIYGRLDLKKFKKPTLINSKPILIDSAAKPVSLKPVYLHVPPGQELHWRSLCKTYDACAVPVYFVTENWFMTVYLPSVGAQDGRERQYRIEASRERSTERDIHDVHGQD